MLTTLTLATAAAYMGHPGFGFGWLIFLAIPLFILLILAIVGGFARRRWMRSGGWGYYGHSGMGSGAPVRNAEGTLAERFAQGDIDEKEYRARLEVLRASNPVPPAR